MVGSMSAVIRWSVRVFRVMVVRRVSRKSFRSRGLNDGAVEGKRSKDEIVTVGITDVLLE